MSPAVSNLQIKVLSGIAQLIAKALDLEQTLLDVLRICSETLSMKRATVTLINRDTGQLAIIASYGLTPTEEKRGTYRLGEGVTGRIFETAKPFVVPDIRNEPRFLDKTRARSIEKAQVSFLGVPVMLQGQPIGVLTVDRLFDDHVSFDEDLEFLQVVAALVAQFVSLGHQFQDLRRENAQLKSQVISAGKGPYIVGRSLPMAEVQRQVEKVAPTRATVLLTGESGTGKTLIGRVIHELSDRKHKPFIKVNCASIPENLLESELFGHEKGAFTGADRVRPGRFEEAHGGTMFLDEVGELSLGLQAKLLRVLQEKEFERLGSSRTRKVDVRILAATNRELQELTETGRFRPDLYYRLAVFPIHAPPLRERKEDVEILLLHFLAKVSREYGRKLHFTGQALERLKHHHWPGNVREMENLVERLVILAESENIDVELISPYLPRDGRAGPPQSPAASGEAGGRQAPGASLAEMEKNEILQALERNRWVQQDAAAELGITPRQMGYRIKKHKLDALVAGRRALAKRGEGSADGGS
jgi:Nif-specific regulatory protein